MSDTVKFRRYDFGTRASKVIEAINNVKFEGGYAIRGDKSIKSNVSHMDDWMQYAMNTREARAAAWLKDAQHYGWQPDKHLTFWQTHVERRWDEVKRRVVNAWAALRGDWERDYDY